MLSKIHRVVVLGHTGFLGSKIFSHIKSSFPEKETLGFSSKDFNLTVGANTQSLSPYFDSQTVLIMCAGIKRQKGDTAEIFQQNIQMIINLIKVLKKNPVSRMVYISSAAVYGEDIDNQVIDELTPIQPRSYYGLSKYTAECLLNMHFENVQSSSLGILRPPTIYGPFEALLSYGPNLFLDAICNSESITLWGDGSELRELIYVDDLVDIACRFASIEYEGPLNVAAGYSYTFKDVVLTVEKVTGKKSPVSSRERTKEKVNNAFKPDLLKSLFPDYTFIDLEEGVRKIYEIQYAGSSR